MASDILPESGEHTVIRLICLGRIDPTMADVLAANIQTILGINADISIITEKPGYAFVPGRGQFDAGKILRHLASVKSEVPLRLGVTAYDLCTPILTFVYGESELGGTCAVISINRIRHNTPEITYLRAVKIGLHEVGHLFGIGHCWEPGCLMQYSHNLEKLDALNIDFCSACRYEINRRKLTLMKSACP
ncbi:MAG: hypothetical protein HKM93_07835 [Desulfobacteraceae bacterium]|nr:hypothetical protein [Desulfobacteraceae bacterium]